MRKSCIAIYNWSESEKPLTHWRPPWCWWSDTGPVRRWVLHSGKPSHTTGPRMKPGAAVRWGVARLCRSWRWRPRSGCWSWAGGWKDWEGCPAKPQMSSLEEMELGGSKSPARAEIKQPGSELFSVLYCKNFDRSATKKLLTHYRTVRKLDIQLIQEIIKEPLQDKRCLSELTSPRQSSSKTIWMQLCCPITNEL